MTHQELDERLKEIRLELNDAGCLCLFAVQYKDSDEVKNYFLSNLEKADRIGVLRELLRIEEEGSIN